MFKGTESDCEPSSRAHPGFSTNPWYLGFRDRVFVAQTEANNIAIGQFGWRVGEKDCSNIPLFSEVKGLLLLDPFQRRRFVEVQARHAGTIMRRTRTSTFVLVVPIEVTGKGPMDVRQKHFRVKPSNFPVAMEDESTALVRCEEGIDQRD